MIDKSHRFHGHASLNHVYRYGKVVHATGVSIKFCQSQRSDYRLAIVVSKKVSKSAVTRNRIRRRLYEAVRLAKLESSQPWQYDLVISVFSDQLASQTTAEIRQTVDRLLTKSALGPLR